MTKLNTQLTEKVKEIKKLKEEDIKNLNDKMTEKDKEIKKLKEEDIKNLNDKMTTKDLEISQIKGEMSSLREDLESLSLLKLLEEIIDSQYKNLI